MGRETCTSAKHSPTRGSVCYIVTLSRQQRKGKKKMNNLMEKPCSLAYPRDSLGDSHCLGRCWTLSANSTAHGPSVCPAAWSGGGQWWLLFAICTSAELAYSAIYFKPMRSIALLLLHQFGQRESILFFSFIIYTVKPLSLKATARTFVISSCL